MNTDMKEKLLACMHQYGENWTEDSMMQFTKDILGIAIEELREDFEHYNSTEFLTRATALSYIDRKYTQLTKAQESLSPETK
jgi:hypothetical protein